MVEVIGVRFKDAGKVYYFAPGKFRLRLNDNVIVETARGIEFGTVAIANRMIEKSSVVSPLKGVVRIASQADKDNYNSIKEKEKKAFDICSEKIKNHGLSMNLLDVEYTFDLGKVLFYFTADGRVDFRELVKDLATVFKTRIELRQIGVRDEAKMLGGYGICGRFYCCGAFLGGFDPVSIKMAKEQSLSLNPTKISGSCGRLMCCLKYEQDVYEKLNREMPRVGAIVDTPMGKGCVIGSNILAGQIKVKLDSAEGNILENFSAKAVKIIRNAEIENDVDAELIKELKKLEE